MDLNVTIAHGRHHREIFVRVFLACCSGLENENINFFQSSHLDA